jgi:FHS family L-fucose permease-like MFS transporter
MTKKIDLKYLIPVLMSFFVMSFCDLVGISVDSVKNEFHLNDTMVQLIPSVVFIWFFVFSIPVGVLQDRIGKRTMLNIGMGMTALGLFIPFFLFTFPTLLIGFALLGIGNTIVQVSANPLLVDVVPSDRRSSFLSFSQFIKAIGTLLAPYLLVALISLKIGDLRTLFLIFGIISLLSVLWLASVRIGETRNLEKRATFTSSLKLLSTGFIAMMALGIFLVVGIDVSVNTVSGRILETKFSLSKDSEFVILGRSAYLLAKMLGTFGGALMLALLPSRKFFLWSSVLSVLSIITLIFAPSVIATLVILFIIGLGVANIFPLIFSLSVEKYPDRSNEISGLMIMAVSGGAVIPLLIGMLKQNVGITAGIMVLVVCAIYLLFTALVNLKKGQAPGIMH